MSTSNNSFRWIDRDTAARDLLHLYENNIPFLRERIERLLYAVRSPAVIPYLLKIALDDAPVESLSRLLQVVAATAGNFYFSDLKELAEKYPYLIEGSSLNFLKHHPVNKEQILTLVLHQLSKIDEIKRLHIYYYLWLESFPEVLTPRLTQLIDDNPKLFNLATAAHLHTLAGEWAADWLAQRWDEIIYLCLIDGKRDRSVRSPSQHRLVHILEDWPELKEDLFRRCPAIIEEYSLRKSASEMRSQPKARMRSTYAWQELEMDFGLALQSGEDSIKKFLWRSRFKYPSGDVLHKAGATYLVGTVVDRYSFVIRELEFALEYNADQWREEEPYDVQIHYPVRFEAANALRKIVTASTWESLLRAYLKEPFRELIPWIADLTDQLSGVDVTPSVELELERRPWFWALAEAESAYFKNDLKSVF